MTQQVDPRNPASAHPGQPEPPLTPFTSKSHTGAGAGEETKVGARTSGGSSGTSAANDRWPSLVSIRQVITAFVLEIVSTSRPLREKLNIVVLRIWHQYLVYAQAYPLLTIFLSTLVMLSAGPFMVFACVTGVSLGLLIGTAAVVVIVIQSIVVSIAGAILLFVLGTIVVLTLFTFFWLVVGYMGFKVLRDLAVVAHGHHQKHQLHRQQQQQQQHQQQHQQQQQQANINMPEKFPAWVGDAAVPEI